MEKKTGEQLKIEGMEQALNNAERIKPNWGDIAYLFLKRFITTRRQFMTEDVRKASEGVVPEPPSNRAWGAVIVRAKKSGLIAHMGYGQVKNPKAHSANASIWIAL